MKKALLLACSLLFLFSCSQKESSINITAQIEIMKQDPVSMEYFEAIAASAKIIAKGGVNLKVFKEIMKRNNRDYCNVKKEAFNGHIEMEHLAKTQCRLIRSLHKLHKKFPFLKEMDREDKKKLFAPLIKKQEYDIEKIIRNLQLNVY